MCKKNIGNHGIDETIFYIPLETKLMGEGVRSDARPFFIPTPLHL